MKRTELRRDIPAHLPEGRGSARRASGRAPSEGQGACRQGRFESPEKPPEVIVVRLVIQDGGEEALVAALSDRGEPTEETSIHFIGGDIARPSRQGPGQAVRVHAHLRLFSPQPPPRAGWWQRGPRRGGHARGASSPGGKAHRPRPRAVPPEQSHGEYTDRRVGRTPRGPRYSTGGTSYSRAAPR